MDRRRTADNTPAQRLAHGACSFHISSRRWWQPPPMSRALVGNPDWRLLDARAPERFRGEVEPIDKVAGHIPGAVNVPFLENLDEGGTFKPAADLAARFHSANGSTPTDHVVVYCGSGVTACQNLLALEHAGLHGAKLYPGSWSEWSSDPSRPIEAAEVGQASETCVRRRPSPTKTLVEDQGRAARSRARRASRPSRSRRAPDRDTPRCT